MATLRFFINGSKRDLVPIYARLIISRKERFICKTGFIVEPDRWSNDTQTIKQRKLSENDLRLINSLFDLRQHIDKENRFYAGIKSKSWLQSVINKFHGVGNDIDLNGFIQSYIDRIDSGELKNEKGVNYSKGTVRAFKGCQGAINTYQGIYTDKEKEERCKGGIKLRPYAPLDFMQINNDFYHKFIRYLSDEGYKINTQGRFIKELSRIMAVALREKKHNNREFEYFTVITEESHAIYLTLEEIDKIYNHQCDDERQELARDCFVVLCETALRISDYKKINVSIKGRFIEIFQQKTAGKVVIPLTARMSEILEKYHGRLPYIHENYVNEYIKTIAFRCGLTDTVRWVTQEKGLKFEKAEPKWSLVTCHTGRRSAATNMYLAGISTIDIMKITGHRTEKAFLKYIKISEEETAVRLSKHEYFNQLRIAK